ncbi:MAG: NAD(P)H-binding protein [Myxococcota bacterium]
MKIAIIGATGGSGRHFLELASGAGHEVTALARTVEKLSDWQNHIQVVQADGRDLASLAAALDPSIEVVVNIVGASNLSQARKVTDLYSVTSSNLIDALYHHGIRRLVSVSSSGVEPQENDNWFYVHILKRFFLQPMYDDMLRMEALFHGSTLDYTIVRPPYLTKGAPTGKYRTSVDANFTDDKTLRRGDLAHFLLRACEDADTWSRSMVALSE